MSEYIQKGYQLSLIYQKKLLVLFYNDSIAEYSINAIDLWNQIGLKDKFENRLKTNVFNYNNIEENNYKFPTWEQNTSTHLIDIEII